MLLTNDILWHTQLQAVYDEIAVATGRMELTAKWWTETEHLLKSIFAFYMIFICCLWAVKLSFLLFFWRLGERATGHKIWWWCVLVVTIAAWAISVAIFQFNCSLKPLEYILGWQTKFLHVNTAMLIFVVVYCQSQRSHAVQARAFRINTSMDILTDVLSPSLPSSGLSRISS